MSGIYRCTIRASYGYGIIITIQGSSSLSPLPLWPPGLHSFTQQSSVACPPWGWPWAGIGEPPYRARVRRLAKGSPALAGLPEVVWAQSA